MMLTFKYKKKKILLKNNNNNNNNKYMQFIYTEGE